MTDETPMAAANDHRLTFLATAGGTLTGLMNALQAQDLVRTCILAAAGTVVSFLVTLVLKRNVLGFAKGGGIFLSLAWPLKPNY